MKMVTGVPVCPGVAVGPLFVFPDHSAAGEPLVGTPEEELRRFFRARQEAYSYLEQRYQAALAAVGREGAEVFHLLQELLADQDYQDAVADGIRTRGLSAGQAALTAGDRFAQAFRAMSSPYMRERAADIQEVSRLVADILAGVETEPVSLPGPVILAAEQLSAGQLMGLEREKLLGLILSQGGANCHVALLARAMELPAVTGVEVWEDWKGLPAALDGETGQLWLEPDHRTLERLNGAEEAARAARAELRGLKDRPAVTRDGRRVVLCANIGGPEECAAALENGAEGVGLFRTEFLWMNAPRAPTEEEQLAVYRRAAEGLGGRRLVIRTLDIGGDKRPAWMSGGREENPALSLRGIRLSLAQPELFLPQLRAILQAAVFGRVAVMFPMVTSADEIRRARALLERCRAELGDAAGPVEVGVMIETPAAALMANELAGEADFFSIGTNDLSQYILAADREGPATAGLCDARHPAVLELVERTVAAAHRRGIRAAVCGGLAADGEMTGRLLGMGVDELSVPPADLLPLRRRVLELDLSQ